MRQIVHFLIFVFGLMASPWTLACAICAPADAQSTVMARLRSAERIVLARVATLPADGAPASDFDVQPIATLRGADPASPLRVAGWLTAPSASSSSAVVSLAPGQDAKGQPLKANSVNEKPTPGRALVLIENRASQSWWVVGAMDASRLGWLQRALSLPPAPTGAKTTPAAFFIRWLEDPEPLIAQAAYEEVSARPYAELRALLSEMDGTQMSQRLRQWVEQPHLRGRWPLYGLLHGLTGTDADAERLMQRLRQEDVERTPAQWSAWVAALLELRGNAALDWVERQWWSQADWTQEHAQAVLLGLSVHGNAPARVCQDRVVQAYQKFIRQQPQWAGFVASDLANWQRWEFAPDFAQALRSGATQAFASRYAIVFYLLRNPTPEARQWLERLRTEKLL